MGFLRESTSQNLKDFSIPASDSILVNSERVLAYSEVYEHTLRPTNKQI